jgi:large subunit ribosomal protein L13
MGKDVVVIDATDSILGRVASYVAKRALAGDSVIVLNAEKAVISGDRKSIVRDAKLRLETRTLGSQKKAPTHPRRPDILVRRVIRGMLPWRQAKGRDAFHRIKVYIGVPQEYSMYKATRLAHAAASRLRCSFIRVSELSEEIGGPKL